VGLILPEDDIKSIHISFSDSQCFEIEIGNRLHPSCENNNQINKDLRPLQKSYLFLKKWKADGLFCVFIKLLNKPIKSNLLSNNPSMFLFDIYRLKYFIELKKNNN